MSTRRLHDQGEGISSLQTTQEHVWSKTIGTHLASHPETRTGKARLHSRGSRLNCLFRFQGNSIEIAGWYVDDGLLAADSSTTMKKMVDDIGGSFDIQDLGEPERLLGIRIKHNRDVGTIHLSQPAFINTIAKHLDITIGRPAKSPMDATINYRKTNTDEKPADVPYTSIIGSLNYCTIATQPDILYATNKCAQFTLKLSQVHWEAAKRILQYLLQTRDHSITFHRERRGTDNHPHLLTSFTDADFAGDSNDRRSTSGWVY